jgi:hypothetical protein
MLFEFAGKIAGVLVSRPAGRFLHRAALAQQFNGEQLTLFRQPHLGRFAHLLEKMPLQRPHRNTAFRRQRRRGPFDLPRQFRPILDLVKLVHHTIGVSS